MALNNGLMGNNPNKRRIEAAQREAENKPQPKVYFSENFIPARGYALVECVFLGAKSSSLVAVPQQVHGQQQYAVIRRMGAGKHHFDGSIIEPEWKPGDCVYARISEGLKFQDNGKNFVILGTEWIFGKFDPPPQEFIEAEAALAASQKSGFTEPENIGAKA